MRKVSLRNGTDLDQFVAVTGYHRKHADRLLRSGRTHGRYRRRPGRRIYDTAVREALIVWWEAADRICGKRLKPLLPVLVNAMERHGHLQLALEVREGSTIRCEIIARRLASRSPVLGPIARTTKPGSSRRMAPLCASLWAIGALRAWRPPGRITRLYASLRLFVNFFQPSFKLAEKQRDGARVMQRYHAPATPYQRLIADPRTSDQIRGRLSVINGELGPVRLLREMHNLQPRPVEIADKPIAREANAVAGASLEQFLEGLRTAWKEGEVRPTSRPKIRAKRLRRRPDPFAPVIAELRAWFEAEPWRTGRELLQRLQAQLPGIYPDSQLRTLQRRLKVWRCEIAQRLVFGSMPVGSISEPWWCCNSTKRRNSDPKWPGMPSGSGATTVRPSGPTQRIPTIADHLRAQHQVLEHEGVVSFDPRARPHVHAQHPALDADPRCGLAASAMLAMARRLRCRRIIHAAWLDVGAAVQTLQSRDLIALLCHNPPQLGNLASSFITRASSSGRKRFARSPGGDMPGAKCYSTAWANL